MRSIGGTSNGRVRSKNKSFFFHHLFPVNVPFGPVSLAFYATRSSTSIFSTFSGLSWIILSIAWTPHAHIDVDTFLVALYFITATSVDFMCRWRGWIWAKNAFEKVEANEYSVIELDRPHNSTAQPQSHTHTHTKTNRAVERARVCVSVRLAQSRRFCWLCISDAGCSHSLGRFSPIARRCVFVY